MTQPELEGRKEVLIQGSYLRLSIHSTHIIGTSMRILSCPFSHSYVRVTRYHSNVRYSNGQLDKNSYLCTCIRIPFRSSPFQSQTEQFIHQRDWAFLLQKCLALIELRTKKKVKGEGEWRFIQ